MIELNQKIRDELLKDWQEKLLARYPIKVVEVTSYIEECTTKIFDKLIETFSGGSYEGVEEPIDDLMRFLALDKKLSPGDSVAQLLYLKTLLLTNFPKMEMEDFIKLNNIIDRFARIAFDRYSACREDIFNLRVMEKEREIQILRKILESCGDYELPE
jgi:hypothetical protein